MTKYPICPKCGEMLMPVIDEYYYCSTCDEEHISYEAEGEE